MSNLDDVSKSLEELNNTMIKEEQTLKEYLATLEAMVEALMTPHMPAPENRPAEPTVTIVNVETGEEKVITQSEYNEMVKNSIN